MTMTGEKYLVNEFKKYKCICYYPSSGPDLSNIDYFASGKKLWSERVEGVQSEKGVELTGVDADNDPDLFIHTDINFYQEFEAGKDMESGDCGIHGCLEVVEFRGLPRLSDPNLICDNLAFSGKCFEYKLRLWGSEKIRTLIYCLCENEYIVARLLLANNIKVPLIWSRNWFGGHTYGTWMANILDRLGTRKVYTDWLCVPGKRGEPRNLAVAEKYPELMVDAKVNLVRNNKVRWIDESAHGWVEEFDVTG